jgi:hypothetical protein
MIPGRFPAGIPFSQSFVNAHSVILPLNFVSILRYDTTANAVNENIDSDPHGWSSPQTLELPFSTRLFFPELQPTAATPHFTPHLLAGNNGRIHAFWLDDEDRLYHSSVANEAVADFSAWSDRQQLAESARALATTLAPDGRIHLAYVRPIATENFPAGIYYRSLDTDGVNWSAATLLYQSPYLRGVPATEAHVHIAAAGQGEAASFIYVGWDNRQRDQLFLTRSTDGGLTWDEPQPIDSRRPGDAPQATGPSQLLLHARASHILLTWQAGHDGRTCDQYVQASADAGDAWSEPQPLTELLSTCPTGVQLLPAGPDLTLLLARSEEQGSQLLLWDGGRWSDARRQTTLETFTDPDTFRPVDFGCYQGIVYHGRLWVAGCDQGRSQDIWLIGRPLGDLADWFPPPPEEAAWQMPLSLAEPATMPAGLSLIGDANGRFHLFWPDTAQSAIAYARHEGGQWSRPSPVLRNPDGASRAVRLWPSTTAVYWSPGTTTAAVRFSLAGPAATGPRPLLNGFRRASCLRHRFLSRSSQPRPSPLTGRGPFMWPTPSRSTKGAAFT